MRLFDKILDELGNPAVFLVSPEQYLQLEGKDWKKRDDWGWAGEKYPIVSKMGKCDRRVTVNIYYHEILHIIMPHRPEWWIECAAYKLARGGGTGTATPAMGHSPDELPDRKTILKWAIRASKKFNEMGNSQLTYTRRKKYTSRKSK